VICQNGEKARIMIRKVPFLKGAFTPLVVPLKSGAVDYDQYADLIEWQIKQRTQPARFGFIPMPRVCTRV
jgi:hypothetical protein